MKDHIIIIALNSLFSAIFLCWLFDYLTSLLTKRAANWRQKTPLAIAQGFTSVLLDDFNKKTQGPHPNVEAVLLKFGAQPWVPPVRPDPTATLLPRRKD